MAATRVIIIGAGPAGIACASAAARLGAEVVLVEKEILGGASHLMDCIPSKALIGMSGQGNEPHKPLSELRSNVVAVSDRLKANSEVLLNSQNVKLVKGSAQLKGPKEVVVENESSLESFETDVVVLATGSSPRIPDWCTPDGNRTFITRQVYPPPEIPEHIVIVGSGVSGVELTHMFNRLGSQVTLLVSRQHVLPNKDPEVAAVLEEDFQSRGVVLLKGARANGVEMGSDFILVCCEDGRQVKASHMLLAIGQLPNSESLGLESAGVETKNGYVPVDRHLRTNIEDIYAAGDLTGRLHLSSVAMTQGKKIAEHAMGLVEDRPHRHIDYDKAPTAIFTDPEIADVGLAEVDAFSVGRKVRVTKVPFSVSARALIQGDSRGFVKIVSDPATGAVLGGSVVGRHSSELITVVSLAITAGLTVTDFLDSMSVHPTLAEVLLEAAE